MISRARQQNKVHIYIYCNNQETHIKYKCIEDVINETKCYENHFCELMPNTKILMNLGVK